MVQVPSCSSMLVTASDKASAAIGISFFEAALFPVIAMTSPGCAFLTALRISTKGTGQVSPLTST